MKILSLTLLLIFLPKEAGTLTTLHADHPRPPLGTFVLTAYHGPQLPGMKLPYTASGKIAKSGRTIAVDPRVIPMGSKVYIQGVGLRVAEDTGGAIKGKRIDVYMRSKQAAKNFGRRKAVVFPNG